MSSAMMRYAANVAELFMPRILSDGVRPFRHSPADHHAGAQP